MQQYELKFHIRQLVVKRREEYEACPLGHERELKLQDRLSDGIRELSELLMEAYDFDLTALIVDLYREGAILALDEGERGVLQARCEWIKARTEYAKTANSSD